MHLAISSARRLRTNQQEVPVKALSDGTYEKLVVGPTRVLFGAGASVLQLKFGNQSRCMALENLHLDMTKEKIRTALELRFGEVKDVNVILSDDHVTALVTMSAREAADDALGFMQHAIPEGLRKAPHSRLVAYSVPESGGQQMSHLNATIEISCHYPSQIAWANFRDWRQAQKAAQKLNGRIFGGRQLQAKLNHTTVPPGGSVSITNIPLKTRAEDLRRFIHGACDLKVKPPKYTISDIKRNLPIRKPGLFRDIFNER